MNWKFTNNACNVVFKLLPNNGMESHSVESPEIKEWLAAGNIPTPADPLPNPRITEIKTRLDQIDIESIRALRAKSVGKGKAQDDTKLSALDTEADNLRAELATVAKFT